MEVDEWFVFSGYTHAIEEKVRKEKHAATFSYGWAVRKEDGKIVRWDEPPPTFVEDDADLISPIPEGHR